MTLFSLKRGLGQLLNLLCKKFVSTFTHTSEKGTEKVPRGSALEDSEPLLLNPRHSLVELLLSNHPFEKVSDKLLALRCKVCSSLIDGVRLQNAPPPVALLFPKGFPYDTMRFRSGQPLQGE